MTSGIYTRHLPIKMWSPQLTSHVKITYFILLPVALTFKITIVVIFMERMNKCSTSFLASILLIVVLPERLEYRYLY